MQESSRPLYARVGALSAAALLAVSGAFIAGPAMADTGDTPQPTTTETPAAAMQGTGELAPGLEEALQRDLGMTVDEFVAAGDLGKKASDNLERLKATAGFVGIEVLDGSLVITGSGEELQALATELDATVVKPEAPVVEAPSAEPAPAASPAVQPAETEAAEDKAPADVKAKRASDLRSLLSEYAAATGSADKLQSVSGNIEQGFELKVGDPAEALGSQRARGTTAPMTPQQFDELYSNVTVTYDHGTTLKFEDIPNGSGYLFATAEGAFACSIGFAGFNADGEAAAITAGHCPDGAFPETTLEHHDYDLGLFSATYEFGGTETDPGTDIGVIDDINPELTLLPETLQWENVDDLSATTVKVTGTTSPVVGAPICKSGRTTFWTCGTILQSDHLVNVEGSWVEGFEAQLQAAQGDSGGSMISGNLAVGLISAGVPGSGKVTGADLDRAMPVLSGYTLAIHLDAPALTSPANNGTVDTDAVITGTATGAKTVDLTVDGVDSTVEVAADGTWSFKAPTLVPADEKLTITAQAVNGYSKSTVSNFELTVKEAPLPAPVFTTPATVLHSIETVEGTGVAGATVSLTVPGDAEEEEVAAAAVLDTEVDDEGNWAVTLEEPLTYGVYKLSAVQGGIAGKEDSAAATLNLTVAPDAPVITSPTDGQEFVEGSLPNEITGTGTAGVEVTVAVDDEALEAVVVDEDGNWSVPMGDLTAGDYAITAVQTINSAPSADASAGITVTAAPVVVNPAPAANPGGGLPDTGAANLGLLAGGGASLLAAGAAALMYNKRRRVSVDA
ncbi:MULTISPECIES: LPXTG cell wall anchor domain-containing protein [unclassified Arthrobacter]|uniref:LPXTG cell wall anchor domain-containing protein n=1 Tax=unclassified Arthrobacter TaxID=235627 RepID=UPI002107D73B|nr:MULTISPECIES: LPXTG cell wall anchor domain-containing protein [unclassified Arthrobacter]MCQ1986163.1 LPXTG cell wall anchor domain-containing protein [Arthrobacter sp. zg-Y844]MCQ1994097.1 LPXTG cell wall anchor domain-containing protein [Arthrobacter sp. zg-Y1171]UWX81798.1 LPXTG cell wall anchor domain-containing protein [Arthrobacter sp. zg-Y1171]